MVNNHRPAIRRYPFENIHNVRDLGGYAVPGGVTAWGRVLRAGQLSHPTQVDFALLEALDVRTIIDLRTQGEVTEYPDAAGIKSEHHHVDFMRTLPERDNHLALGPLYLAIAQNAREAIKQAVELVAKRLSQGGAVLFHCAVGKDRTGILAALLLLTCGVSREDVVADYQVSGTHIQTFLQQVLGEKYDPHHEGGRSLPATMEALLDHFDTQGGAQQYLLSLGVSQQTLDTIRQHLVQPYSLTNA